MKNHFKLATLLVITSSSLFGGKNTFPVTSPVAPIIESKDIFIDLSAGIGSLSIKNNVQDTVLLDGSLDETANLIDLGLGYRLSENLFATVSFQKSYLDFVSIDNTYVSLNYQLNTFEVKPFIGILGGVSNLSWDDDPILEATIRDTKSRQKFYGIQLGAEWELNKDFSIVANFQNLQYKHKTFVNKEEIEHKFQNNFTIGVRYDIR